MTDCFTQLSITRSRKNYHGIPLADGKVHHFDFKLKIKNTQLFKSLQSNCKDTLSSYDRGESKCMGLTAKGTPCKCNTVGQNDYNHNDLPSVLRMVDEVQFPGMDLVNQVVAGGVEGILAFHKIYIKRTYNYDDCRTVKTDFSGLRQMCGRCSKRYNHGLGPKKTDITHEKLLENHGYGIRNGYIIIK